MIPDALDTTVYYVDHTHGDLVDRKAVGEEVRYLTSLFTAYSVYDHDQHFWKTNPALLNGPLRSADESSISVAVDHCRSPMLATLNAIIGQGVENSNDLLPTHWPEEVYQFAQGRTAYSRKASISVSRPITENPQVDVDGIASKVSGAKASAGVEAFPSTGTEHGYAWKLVASVVLTEGATFIAGVRHADTMIREHQALQVKMPYLIVRDRRPNTKLRVDHRKRKDASSDETSARGPIALSYNLNRSAFFVVELGGQFSDSSNPPVMAQERRLFEPIGLRQDF